MSTTPQQLLVQGLIDLKAAVATAVGGINTRIDAIQAIAASLTPPVITPPPPPPPVVDPPVTNPPATGWAVPDVMDINITDAASLTKYIHPGWMSSGTDPSLLQKLSADNNPTFAVDPVNGLHYIRCGGSATTNNERILDWQAWLGGDYGPLMPFTNVQELWLRWVFMVESDSITGMNPAALGCKLSGFKLGSNGWACFITELETRNLPTKTTFPVYGYSYSKEGSQKIDWPNPGFDVLADAYYTFEMRLKLNSTPSAHDGEVDYWINGAPVFSRRDAWFLDEVGPTRRISQFQIQAYMGGVGNYPKGPCHVRYARLAASTKGRIGPCPELPYKTGVPPIVQPPVVDWVKVASENDTVIVTKPTTVRYGAAGKYVYALVSGNFVANNTFFKRDPIQGTVKTVDNYVGLTPPVPEFTYPAVVTPPSPPPPPTTGSWMVGVKKGVFNPIAGTEKLSGILSQIADPDSTGAYSTTGLVNVWNGACTDGASLIMALNGGHGVGSNAVIKAYLGADAPRFVVLDPGSKPIDYDITSSYNKDKRPVGRHTYHSTQRIGNKVLVVGCDAPYQVYMPGANWNGHTVDSFDLASNTWAAAGTHPDAPFGSSTNCMAVCSDGADIYIAAQDNFACWRSSTNRWESLGDLVYKANGGFIPSSWEWHPTLIDHKRNRWTALRAPSNGQVLMVSLDLTTWKVSTLPVALPDVDGYSNMVYDADNDRYLSVQNGALIAINPDTVAVTTLCPAPRAVNGTQNRLQYLSALGGVAYLPEFDSPVLFYPTR